MKGCESLNPEFEDYVKVITDMTPPDCPVVLNIICNNLSQDEKDIIEEEFSKQTLSNFYDEMDYFQRWFRYGKQERRGDKKWSFGAAVWGRRVIRKGAYGSDY